MKLAVVAIGGAAGSVLRYLITHVLLTTPSHCSFPWGTFAVNLSGSLLIGIAAAFSHSFSFSAETRILIFTGLLGGFTTFSSLAFEGFNLFQCGETLKGFAYVGLTNLLGIALAASGYFLTAHFLSIQKI